MQRLYQEAAPEALGELGRIDARVYTNWADRTQRSDQAGSEMMRPGQVGPMMALRVLGLQRLDLIRWLADRPARSVTAVGWESPWSWNGPGSEQTIAVTFEGGLVATLLLSSGSLGHRTEPHGHWRIEGRGGSLSLEGRTLRRLWSHRARPPTDRRWVDPPGPPVEQNLLDDFFSAIEADSIPQQRLGEDRANRRLTEAAMLSAQLGRRIDLDGVDSSSQGADDAR
jgi:predicted dehydrogenase